MSSCPIFIAHSGGVQSSLVLIGTELRVATHAQVHNGGDVLEQIFHVVSFRTDY
jgi:hypothetical protein